MDYPPTSPRPVTDEYHGIPVTDPYRWLEDAGSAEVRAWTAAQNQLTRQVLDAVTQRAEFHARLSQLYGTASPVYFGLQSRPGRLFAIKRQPPLQQPLLVTLASADDLASERALIDPNQLDPTGDLAIDWYAASADGKRVAVSLSRGGSERGDLHFWDAETGHPLAGDVIARVQIPTGGGSAAWAPDGSGLYYTRYPRPGQRPDDELDFYQHIYFHRLGDPDSDDRYVIGRDFPKIAECLLSTTPDGRWMLLMVLNGDGGEIAHYLCDAGGAWTQVTRFEDQCQAAVLGPDQHLYLLSRQGAPRGQILRLPLADPRLSAAQVVVPEGPLAIQAFMPTDRYLYLAELDGGPSRLRVVDHQGASVQEIPIEPVSAIVQLEREAGDAVLYLTSSFLKPVGWWRFDPAEGAARPTALVGSSPADFSDCEVVREFARSRDGTAVPLNIIRRKGTRLDGDNPVLLTGYGGYGISLSPYFASRRRLWLDQGGVVVVANLRGGGEYGQAWHLAGNLANKQNVFDDFIACAEHLIAANYTRPARLCIEGASNGGLLMGAVLTQRPDLFRAVVAHVGFYDMLRAELDSNGAFNVTEFGTVTNPNHFEALYDYSPYHRVQPGAPYPAVLLLTGENDGRVLAYHSRKMAARLQAATASPDPILLRTNSAGHGLGTSLDETIALDADVFAFLYRQVFA
jgi:prolyl oligopeptidase